MPLFALPALLSRTQDDLLKDMSGRRVLGYARQRQVTDDLIDDRILGHKSMKVRVEVDPVPQGQVVRTLVLIQPACIIRWL